MKANELKKIINRLVSEEVKKQLGEIFINEIKSKRSTPIQESVETSEYPTMGGGTYDTSKMSELLGYGNMLGDAESRRKASAVQTAQTVGADTSDPAVQNVMSAMTKDYRGVMSALKKKDGKI